MITQKLLVILETALLLVFFKILKEKYLVNVANVILAELKTYSNSQSNDNECHIWTEESSIQGKRQ